MSGLPTGAYAAALPGMHRMTLTRLAALLRHHSPSEAWAVLRGEHPPAPMISRMWQGDATLRADWRKAATADRLEHVWATCGALGQDVLWYGHEQYPAALLDDPFPPPVLFSRGDLGVLAEGRRVGIVGTRNATAIGREAARSLGEALGAAGVHVVSGLARGIDGHAHRGLLASGGAGRPVGVVASGLDVVYPREHRELWQAVAASGLMFSEAPPGVKPEPYRFPLRNRIVAALSELVVVVESREKGGSLITADLAVDRNVPVMAVPGPVGKRAASGTNHLIAEGATPVIDPDDVLTALSFQHERSAAGARDLRARPRYGDEAVYRALYDEPRTVEGVSLVLGLGLVEAAMGLARLEAAGWVAQADGWFECVGSPLR